MSKPGIEEVIVIFMEKTSKSSLVHKILLKKLDKAKLLIMNKEILFGLGENQKNLSKVCSQV